MCSTYLLYTVFNIARLLFCVFLFQSNQPNNQERRCSRKRSSLPLFQYSFTRERPTFIMLIRYRWENHFSHYHTPIRTYTLYSNERTQHTLAKLHAFSDAKSIVSMREFFLKQIIRSILFRLRFQHVQLAVVITKN